MSAAQKKAISEAATARWAARKASAPAASTQTSKPSTPHPPSPSVLKLQEQVVDLVSQRSEARRRLSEAHAAYLLAQSAFQAAEANVKATEQDAQYLLGLVAQLENRAPVAAPPAPVLQMPGAFTGITSEPAQAPKPASPTGTYAIGSADDLRREMRGMM